ncbi:CNNM domain-containing protein [Pseudofulvibacter geojedonensis]|uniref:CNNM domain-containing protein n=1 Tax=Pseudofulvibacter geojedonensis TaxID=1123758 RepID=A0ABW3I0Q8_9FLAO
MTLLITYAVLSIFFSFLCSILEAVLLSVTPTFINVKKKEGKAYATSLENLKKDVDKPLIAILTLNTIAHTVGAILVGVQAEQLPFKFEVFGINTVGIVSSIMTILILVVSEIIPKTIGATYWKGLANFTAKALNVLMFPLKWTGILWMLQLTTKLIGKGAHGESILSREDFSAMADIAKEEGVFEESESKVIKNLLNFKLILASDIMTPRSVMKIAEEGVNIKEFFEANKNLRFSRIPIYSKNPDEITGYILKDDVYKDLAEDKDHKVLRDLKRKILVVDREIPIPNLFEQFVQEKEHVALVVDEYGSVGGLVTMEDVIETLLGLEIMDESDTDSNMQNLARKNWEARAKRLGLLDEE